MEPTNWSLPTVRKPENWLSRLSPPRLLPLNIWFYLRTCPLLLLLLGDGGGSYKHFTNWGTNLESLRQNETFKCMWPRPQTQCNMKLNLISENCPPINMCVNECKRVFHDHSLLLQCCERNVLVTSVRLDPSGVRSCEVIRSVFAIFLVIWCHEAGVQWFSGPRLDLTWHLAHFCANYQPFPPPPTPP